MRRCCGPLWCARGLPLQTTPRRRPGVQPLPRLHHRRRLSSRKLEGHCTPRQADHRRLRERAQSGHHFLSRHRPNDGRSCGIIEQARPRHQRHSHAHSRQPGVPGQPGPVDFLAHRPSLLAAGQGSFPARPVLASALQRQAGAMLRELPRGLPVPHRPSSQTGLDDGVHGFA